MKRIQSAMLLLFVLALAAPAFAQLPPVIEGLQNPSVTIGASMLKTDPGVGFQRYQPFVEASVPLLRIGNFPCALFGIGVTAEALDPALTDVNLGFSIPLVTCAPKSGQFVVKAGYAKIATGVEKPDAYFVGVGFSLTSHTTLATKRAAKRAKQGGK